MHRFFRRVLQGTILAGSLVAPVLAQTPGPSAPPPVARGLIVKLKPTNTVSQSGTMAAQAARDQLTSVAGCSAPGVHI
jgi:hypothetical protein